MKIQNQVDYKALEKEYIACACCGSMEHVIAFVGDRYQFGITTVVCKQCGLIFTNPRPVAEWFGDFYRNYYRLYYKNMQTPTAEYLNSGWMARHVQTNLTLLKSYIANQNGRLLDIGSSEGSFLHYFSNEFPEWEVYGIEPSLTFSEFARNHFKLQNVTTGGIEDVADWKDSQFDFITSSHVLEHLLDPNLFFSEARRLLKPDGRLFVDVPDADGGQIGLKRVHIAHVYHYDQRSLSNFATKYGFKVLRIQRGQDRWTINALLQRSEQLPVAHQFPSVDAEQIARDFAAKCDVPLWMSTRRYRKLIKNILRSVLPSHKSGSNIRA